MLLRYQNIKKQILNIPLNKSGYVVPTDVPQYLIIINDLDILIKDATKKIKIEISQGNTKAVMLNNCIHSKNHQFKISNSIYDFLRLLKEDYILINADSYTQSKKLDTFRTYLLDCIPQFKPLKIDDIYIYFFTEVDNL